AFYVQGGVGPHTAAACYTAGASGVVLQDQLLLMPESPLPSAWKRRLENMGGHETTVLGAQLGAPCRILSFPGTPVHTALSLMEKDLEVADDQEHTLPEQWVQKATRHIGWADPEHFAWPVGQGLVQAHAFAGRYASVGRCVRSVMQAAKEQTQLAAKAYPFAPHSAQAADQGTVYPLVQGPMARVSDCPEFLSRVAESGALPFVALGSMSGPEAGALLTAVDETLQKHPWGAGMLGFLPPELYKEHLREVLRVKPSFALLAGGRPDQARQLEEKGIGAYLHVPVPALISSFCRQKVRRLVFEGRESGGHVGPLGSFPLWEAAIATLLEETNDSRTAQEEPLSALFAGGIHDQLSAAMVAAAVAPLSQKVRVGLQMGSVYLLSAEAVQTGAISSEYQEQALACEKTAVLEIGSGHANRCALTPFRNTFFAQRRTLLQENHPPAEIARSLEHLCRGRLKIAAKGISRDSENRQCSLTADQCREQGMYLLGEICTQHNRVTTMPAINEQICTAAFELLARKASGLSVSSQKLAYDSTPSSIAITGIAFFLPGAKDLETYWKNIVDKKELITDLPQRYWDQRLIYNPDKSVKDGCYSTVGGFIDEITFDPLYYGIPPKYVGHISPVQLIPLETARRALEDAGYLNSGFDRQNTAVIFSNSDYGGFLGHQLLIRSYLPLMVGPDHEHIADRLAEWSEESLPGVLPNIVAGRIANRFNLGGPNYILDAACASSTTVLEHGIRELESGRSNVAIVGCAEFGQSPFAYTGFSNIQALSASGHAKVFDTSADGMVMSEGCVVLTLKRLEDAERDGDKIYAVVKAVGASSDGKGMGMTAPLPAGQQRALRRAYAKAGFPISSLGLYEAHGTGTPVGDRAELETIGTILNDDQAPPKSCCIGAGKALMGHTKITAGLAAVVKCVLSMYHGVLPPQGNLESPLPPLKDPDSPLAAYSQAVPWLSSPKAPRRCGISSFGFGGSNAHAVLEEYTAGPLQSSPGGDCWPWELVLYAGRDRQHLSQKASTLLQALEQGAAPKLRDVAYSCARDFEIGRQDRMCLAFVTSDITHLTSLLRDFLLHCDHPDQVPLPVEIICSPIRQQDPKESRKVAFLLPGQGSQYVHMAREDCLYFSELRQALETADDLLEDSFAQPLHRYIFPPGPFSEQEKNEQAKTLQQGQVLQPLMATLSAGYLHLARRLGITADMACGHSLGEFAALYAAGVLSLKQLLLLTARRGSLMAKACQDLGAMAAVKATRERVEAVLEEFREVALANHNAPQQIVISGKQESLQNIVSRLQSDGVSCSVLPVAGAFHSVMMQKVQAPLAQSIAGYDFQSPEIPVYSNITALPYPSDPQAIQSQLQDHLTSKVEFVRQIHNMYDQGARIFVDLGPGRVLSNLVSQILPDKDISLFPIDGSASGLKDTLLWVAQLMTAGLPVDHLALFDSRNVTRHSLATLVQETRPPEPPDTAWILNGCNTRPKDVSTRNWGKQPPLDLESVQALPCLSQNMPTTPSAREQPLPFQGNDILQAYGQYQETMRSFLALQEKVVQGFLGGNAADIPDQSELSFSRDPGQPAPAPSHSSSEPELKAEHMPLKKQGAEVPATPRDTELSSASLIAQLQEMISERTGYPVDMLGHDL
ncbi:MAG: beta-ketoacyl synthase N-terminal-like domain-containing protein, partial [Desulfonatronovibrio sp.]